MKIARTLPIVAGLVSAALLAGASDTSAEDPDLLGVVPLDDSEIGDVSMRGAGITPGGGNDLYAGEMGSTRSPDLGSDRFRDGSPSDVGPLFMPAPGVGPSLPTAALGPSAGEPIVQNVQSGSISTNVLLPR